MSETSRKIRALEAQAVASFDELTDCQDSFIVMGLTEVGELGARAVQVVCLPPPTAGEPRKRLELATRKNGRNFVYTAATDPRNGTEERYMTMSRASLGKGIRYDVVGTGRNVTPVAQALVKPVDYLQQLQPLRNWTGILGHEKIAPFRPQVTGVMSYNRARTILYGFSALSRTASNLTDPEEIELLTRVPHEGSFKDTIRPGIGLLVRNALLDPRAPRPPLNTLLRPTQLPGNDCYEIAEGYLAQLPVGSQVAVKVFDDGPDIEFSVLGPKSS